MYKLCVVIPVYNHEQQMEKTLAGIEQHNLACFVVDDGSETGCKQALEILAARRNWVTLIVRESNGGKGAAVKTGLRAAQAAGYTHVLQVDADGQHDLDDIPLFMAESASHPDALILGCPEFDESMPATRRYARYLTHVWVWINTLSVSVQDAMCGFRVYPVRKTLNLIDRTYFGNRMDFDIEIVVKSHWENVPMISVPTKVRYLQDGVSHFRPFGDNLLITTMHTRLFFYMLSRLPVWLAKQWRR